MSDEKEKILIENKRGDRIGEFFVYNEDPRFSLIYEKTPDTPVHRGDYLILSPNTPKEDRREIIGVSIERMILGAYLIILAPKQVTKPNPEERYIKFEEVDLRPGATFIGGRGSGFYDDEGIILAAQHIGGNPDKFEDWAYYVLGKSNFGELAPQWIILNDIGLVRSRPSFITSLELKPSKTIDDLLAIGDKELFEYFAAHSEKLDELNPKQFEQLVQAIFKNLGFTTEPIGAWNQEDGGVDIIALAKTVAGTELRIAIQCKTSKNKISARPIRELAGVLDAFKAHQGIVTTTSKFTSSAKSEAEGQIWKISLQDRDDIVRKIISLVVPQFSGIINNIK